MRGHFTIQQQLDLGNGATCDVTDTSDPMEIDPETEGPAIEPAVLELRARMGNVVDHGEAAA